MDKESPHNSFNPLQDSGENEMRRISRLSRKPAWVWVSCALVAAVTLGSAAYLMGDVSDYGPVEIKLMMGFGTLGWGVIYMLY